MTASRFEAHPILRVRSPVIGRGEQVFELGTAPVTIGRADECDVVLLEQSASRIHARLLPSAGGWEVVDEDSHGGVFLNGERIHARHLADGDTIRIGDSEIQFVLRPAAQPTVIGSTRPHPAPVPGMDVGVAPTIGTPAPFQAPPRVVQAPAPAPAPPPPAAPAPRVVPAASAPSFVDFGPVGRPLAPEGSAPSFFDLGPVGDPQGQAEASAPSFTGELAEADDASRMERAERGDRSRFGAWIIVLLLLAAIGAGIAVAVFVYSVTWADVIAAFSG